MKKIVTWILFIVVLLCMIGGLGLIIYYNTLSQPTKPSHTSSDNTTEIKDDKITKIEVEGLKKIVIQNEKYSFDDVQVYAITANGRLDVTNDATFPNVDTTKLGNQKITFSYKAFSYDFEITVVAKGNKVDGIRVDTSNVKLNYKQNESLDLANLIVYAVYSDESEEEVSDYIVRDADNNAIELLSKIGNLTVYVIYDNFATSFEITVEEGEESVTPSVQIDGNSMYLVLGLDETRTYDYYVVLNDGTTNIDITQNKTLISTTVGNTYTVSGYVCYLEGDKVNKIIISDYTFEGTDLSTVNAVTETDAQIENYANGMKVGTYEYVTAAPDGFELDALALYLGDKLVSEMAYDGNNYIAFVDLEKNDYRLDAIYKKQEASIVSTYSLLSVTPGYRIRIVGFNVHYGYGSNTLCRVRLFYQGELLYTQYYTKGTFPQDVFKFMLPIKYENYYIIGSDEYNSVIDNDQDWNLIMVNQHDDASKIVIYHDKDEQNVIDYQKLNKDESPKEPDGTNLSYFSSDNLVKYEFVKWSYYNAPYEGNIVIGYPVFNGLVLDDKACEYDIVAYVRDTSIDLNYISVGDVLCSNVKMYIMGGKWLAKTDITNNKKELETTPNTVYTIIFEYTYKNASGDNVTKTTSKQVKTLSAPLAGDASKIQLNKNNSLNYSISRNDKNLNSVELVTIDSDGNKIYNNGVFGRDDQVTISTLYTNSTYNVYYYIGENNVYYLYDVGITITTPDIDEPVIKEVRFYYSYDPKTKEEMPIGFMVIGKIDEAILYNAEFKVGVYVPELEADMPGRFDQLYSIKDVYNDVDGKCDKIGFVHRQGTIIDDEYYEYETWFKKATIWYSFNGGKWFEYYSDSDVEYNDKQNGYTYRIFTLSRYE